MKNQRHDNGSGKQQKLNAHLGEDLTLVCLVRHWPSLGITRDRPLYGLKNKRGKTVAKSKDKNHLLALAAANYSTVTQNN